MLSENTNLTFQQPFVMVAAAVVATLAVARIVRLIVDDDFPPVKWLRERFVLHTPDKWGVLVECPWCVSPYVSIVDIAWAWSSGLHWTWWLGNCWAALSFAASWLNMRDVPPDQR